LAICLFCGWKILKCTRFITPEHADLVRIHPVVEAHEAAMAGDGNEVGLRRRLAQIVRVGLKLGRASRSSRV
ncbi:histidine permease, partial [Colletotrichum orchidophilum]